MKMALGIHKMNSHRWQVRALPILFCRIVRGKKSGKDHNRMEREKKDNPSRDGALPFQVPASVRIRGSAQYRSRSATKFPPTRKRVESRTPPITTYKSRARIASKRKGPSPGQLITTSTSNEPLNNAPILNPKREISGFAAAGSAYR